jgi:hypothetical protein
MDCAPTTMYENRQPSKVVKLKFESWRLKAGG